MRAAPQPIVTVTAFTFRLMWTAVDSGSIRAAPANHARFCSSNSGSSKSVEGMNCCAPGTAAR